MRTVLLSAAVVALALPACDDLAGSEGSSNVAIRFAASSARPATSRASFSVSGAEQLVVTGSNGTLTITDVRFILKEFKLERADGECDKKDDDADDACKKFEGAPAFIDLPLGSGAAVAVSQEVPAGRYEKLKFEAEDIDLDEEKSEDTRRLVEAVRSAFPTWPEDASMVVVGSFTPVGGVPVPFTTFFEAEIEVERRFEPPLVVDDANKVVTVGVDPRAWFLSAGRVIDLSSFDFARTGKVVEFEAKLKDGFTKVEFDD
ncbi:MAG: hypothetical protein KY464_11870 [Gemmatimonadetes bacterium]|nr:hypothetical protein [Gemmatimonadota bacterium]